MAFRVEIAPRVVAQAEAAYLYIRRDSPANAVAWWNGLGAVIDGLSVFPRRFPIAPETVAFRVELRHVNYKGYRVIFRIDRKRVRIVHIRHAARLPVDRGEEVD